jgi:hypothetical protein
VITTNRSIAVHVSVNQDGQIVWTTGTLAAEHCSHSFDPVVLPRALSLAIAKAVIAAQEGGSS